MGTVALSSSIRARQVSSASARCGLDTATTTASETTSGLAFQRAPDHQPPTWPDPAVPQQIHLDIMVKDPTAAGPRVLALGAVQRDGQDIYADPAGHLFCLIRRPGWAPPIPEDT
jgi:hypothetical protein